MDCDGTFLLKIKASISHVFLLQNVLKILLELVILFFLARYSHLPIAPKEPTFMEVGRVDFVISGERELKLCPALVITLAAQKLIPSDIVFVACW